MRVERPNQRRGQVATGFHGPMRPRPPDHDARLVAAAPAVARERERTAYLVDTRDGDYGAGSGFGGRPFLPDGVEHPECPNCGDPLTLIVQLDTAALPEGVARGDGLIQVLYCGAGEACTDGHWEPFAGAHVQRLVARGPGRVSADGDALAPRLVTGWLPVRDLPGWVELDELGLDAGEPPDEAEELPYVGDKLGGWPAWAQGVEYPTCPECGATMGLVLQVDSERTLPVMFGDLGMAHLTQCPGHPEVLGFAWASG